MKKIIKIFYDIKRFFACNKAISIFSSLSLVIIILYLCTLDKPELFKNADDWFNVLFQLAIGFIINFIFYITQVYIPQIKQTNISYECIYKRLKKLIIYMEDIYQRIVKRYYKEYDYKMVLTEQQSLDVLHRLKYNDYVEFFNVITQKNFTIEELIYSRVIAVESCIDKLFSYYTPYISPELMEILEKIPESAMHKSMARLYIPLKNVDFSTCSNDYILKPYYDLIDKLKKISEEYNFKK